jgi:hypothetical protein
MWKGGGDEESTMFMLGLGSGEEGSCKAGEQCILGLTICSSWKKHSQ